MLPAIFYTQPFCACSVSSVVLRPEITLNNKLALISKKCSPGIQCAKEEEEQSHYSLCIPPLDLPRGDGGGRGSRGGGVVGDQL